MGPYLDTSALAKWYLNEPFSEQFEAFIQEQPTAAISRLTVGEFRCLLARRRRAGGITKSIESRVYSSFEKDVGAGFLQEFPVADEHLDLVQARGLAHGRGSADAHVMSEPDCILNVQEA